MVRLLAQEMVWVRKKNQLRVQLMRSSLFPELVGSGLLEFGEWLSGSITAKLGTVAEYPDELLTCNTELNRMPIVR